MDTILYFGSHAKTNAAEKLGGVQDIAAKNGMPVQAIDGLPSRKRLAGLLEFWRPAGAIVECGGMATRADPEAFGALPLVFLDHDPSCLPENAFCVTHDSAATAQMAARELLLSGARHFAWVPYPEPRFWSEERERAFIAALALNGRACSVFAAAGAKLGSPRYQRALRRFLAGLPKPCALFAANDAIGAEVLTAASYAGVKVPAELAVVGVDGAKEICEHTMPSLSSVRPDFRRGGELAALLLIAQLRDGARFRGARRKTFGPLMVERRASTRKLAAADPAAADALELIRREACNGLTAARVLARFPCSRRMAEIRFRKAAGRSVLEEIHSVRLERAKTLLRESTMPLKAIADFCGFGNPNSLVKFFKSATGMPMSAWRSLPGKT